MNSWEIISLPTELRKIIYDETLSRHEMENKIAIFITQNYTDKTLYKYAKEKLETIQGNIDRNILGKYPEMGG